MALKQKQIFARNKPLINIYSGLDHDGKMVEFREDADQLVKWHEIVEALVAAGYYRAQLQGLSEFDKIVGGLTWCIELCDIDVNVNLMFEENLTIGKKIALTEKIVNILPSMKCPHIIEPHQIQGLDFINIYPLIQWLIKYSSEFREAKEDELRNFAIMQYEKNHMFESDRVHFTQEEKVLKNLSVIQHIYKPCRVRKRKGPLPSTELEQVNATLSEYDRRMLMHNSRDQDIKDEGLEFLLDLEKVLVDPSKLTVETSRYDGTLVNDSDSISNRTLHYAILQSELSGESSHVLEERERQKYSNEIAKLTSMLQSIEEEILQLRISHEERMLKGKEELAEKTLILQTLRSDLDKLKGIKDFTNNDMKEFYKALREIVKEKDAVVQTIKHEETKQQKLKEELSTLLEENNKVEDEPLSPSEIKEIEEKEQRVKEYISKLRLELAKTNREVLRLTTAIDDIPGQAELLQYEKRFLELYNQVAAKHKETKQFYTFYNTLYEVKLYTSKELSLLNSILDNYEEAMSSSKKREQFMSQLESIVEWVKQTVKKVEQKYNDEKEKKTLLSNEYANLLEIQRQYMTALKKLAEERGKLGGSIRR